MAGRIGAGRIGIFQKINGILRNMIRLTRGITIYGMLREYSEKHMNKYDGWKDGKRVFDVVIGCLFLS